MLPKNKNTYSLCIADPFYIKKRIGGAEVQMFMIARELVKMGSRVIYVSGSIDCEAIDEGIELIPFRPKRGNESKELAEILLHKSADLCYQRGRKAYSCFAAEACKTANIPYVNAFSMDLDYLSHKFLFRDMSSLRQVAKHLLLAPKHWLLDRCSKQAIMGADKVFFQSERQMQMARSSLGIGGVIVKNLHDAQISATEMLKPQKIRVLWLATIKDWKQPELFLRLAKKLAGHDVEFVMAGNIGHKKYQHTIYSLQEEQPNFFYEPCSSLERSNELIGSAHIFINTSRGEEGFPNTFIQSWLRRTVVISASFDPDGLLAGGLGRCSGSLEKLKEDLMELAGDQVERERIADRAYVYAVENFSIQKNIQQIAEIFTSLIEERRK